MTVLILILLALPPQYVPAGQCPADKVCTCSHHRYEEGARVCTKEKIIGEKKKK